MVLIWLIKVVLYNSFYFFYLSEEEKNEKRECGKNRYRSMSEEKKQRLKEYQKSYYETKKCQYNNE